MIRTLASICLILLAPAAQAQSAPSRSSAPPEAALPTIAGEAIRAHMRFLSDSLLEGRAPDSLGYQIAARYVAAQLEAMGLRPAGVGGTWFQPVPLRKAVLDASRSSLTLIGAGQGARDAHASLIEGRDYVLTGDVSHARYSLEAPIVFVGFGVTASEQGYDDYAGLNVRGKIVLAFYGAPPRFDSTVRAYYSDDVGKTKNALAHGAIALISTLLPEDWRRWPWDWSLPQIRMGNTNWLDDAGEPHDAYSSGGIAQFSLSGATRLFAHAPKTLDEAFAAARASERQGFPLPWRARIHTVSTQTTYRSPNIIAELIGSDPALRDQFIVYTAHLDHLGRCPPLNGDPVCHGSLDNASGVATLLEIARAFANLKEPPRRSLLFVFVTGEEMGLLGSDYFAHHPTVPLKQIVADITIDVAPGLLFPLHGVVASGAEHSSIAGAAESAARRLGYALMPDPMPEENSFIRSDQYSFVLKGVPALYFFDGSATPSSGIDGLAYFRQWLVTRYHTPLDNMEQPLDYVSGAKAAGLNFLVGYELAEADAPPAWNAGDFFGVRFGSKGRDPVR